MRFKFNLHRYAEALVEMPVEASRAELHVWGRATGRAPGPADRMAWLAGPGVYYGHLEIEGLEADAADTVGRGTS